MPDATPTARLIAIAAKLSERHRQTDEFRKLLDPLRQGSVEPVEGEKEVFADIQDVLDKAHRALPTIPPSPLPSDLDALEELLDDPVWEVARDLTSDLQEINQRQEALVKEVDPSLKGMEAQLDALGKIVDAARLAGAPFVDLEVGLAAARSTVSAVRRALNDRIYGELRQHHAAALSQMQSFEKKVSEATDQIERVKKLVKQADLLIMQAGQRDGRYEYRILLRSADRYQTRGINIIQDVVFLDKVDRDWMMKKLTRLTDTINTNYRAAFARKSNIARTVTRVGAELEDAPSQLVVLGKFMARMVIPERVREYLEREPWSFTITTNDLELPWELLCLEASRDVPGRASHLCLRNSISRMPLGQVFPQTWSWNARAGQERRMLLIHSDPDGNLGEAKSEIDMLEQELKSQVKIRRVNPADATNDNLNEILMSESFDFIHYAGHAHFDGEVPDKSGLKLQDTVLTADKIRRLNKGGSLVFLNACESGTVANAAQAQQVSYLLSHPEPVVGLASAFIYTGALGCVGSIWPVYDKPAAELAVKFYRGVLANEPTGEALRRARAEIRDLYPEETTWAAYVLYGDPTFRLTEA